MSEWFWAGLSLSVLLLFVGHWFPWPRKLHRLAAYAYGCGSILIAFALWQLKAGEWITVIGLTAIVAASGAAVSLAYITDWLVGKIRKAWKAERLLNARFDE